MSAILPLLARFWYCIPILLLTLSTLYYRHDAATEHTAKVKVTAEYELFKSEVEQFGKKAEKDKLDQEAKYAKAIKTANDTATVARNDLAAWMRKHPADNSGQSFLSGKPSKPPSADRAGQVCYDYDQLDATLRRFTGDVQILIGRGQEALIDRQELVSGWPK